MVSICCQLIGVPLSSMPLTLLCVSGVDSISDCSRVAQSRLSRNNLAMWFSGEHSSTVKASPQFMAFVTLNPCTEIRVAGYSVRP